MTEESKIIDLNRKRAGLSYINLVEFLNNPDITEESKKKMRGYCRKLPVLIKTNGLLKTLTFIKGKCKDEEYKRNEYDYIYTWLLDWIKTLDDNKDEKNIFDKLINMENEKYSIYTKEVIEISLWYKRHAEAMI